MPTDWGLQFIAYNASEVEVPSGLSRTARWGERHELFVRSAPRLVLLTLVEPDVDHKTALRDFGNCLHTFRGLDDLRMVSTANKRPKK